MVDAVMVTFFRRKGHKRLRRLMRGYRFLKDSKSLGRIRDIKQVLTKQPLNIKERHFSKSLFGEGIGQAELVCRQYLLIRVVGLNLNRALLHALGKPGSPLVYYLPPEWRKIFQNKGFTIASFRSAFMWQAFIGMMFVYGVLIIAKIIFSGIISVFDKSTQQLGRYVYFNDLATGNLPQPDVDGRSYDIITWYKQWTDRIHGLDSLCHGVMGTAEKTVDGTPVVLVQGPILPLTRFGSIARFTAWGLRTCLIAIWDFMRGRWWHALLLNQAALAAQMRLQDQEKRAKEFLFHNSGWIYRPLWTYEAESGGARITFYFYSTNCEGFKRLDGYPAVSYGYQAMNWPYYLVWDEYQAEFVRRAVGETANINTVGNIWFQSSPKEMPVFSGRSVAVFDVTPHRSSRYRTLGADFEFYVPEICIPFLNDIQEVTENVGYRMLWKMKREIGSFAHPLYRHFTENLAISGNVSKIDPPISANRVIERSDAVISMPFTSTALIAREMGKPSCYYDPIGLIQKDDRAAHGIEIVSGKEEIRRWFNIVSVELKNKNR